MNCEFKQCIFNKDSVCITDKIHINEWGMCEVGTFVILPEKELEALKERQLRELKEHIEKGLMEEQAAGEQDSDLDCGPSSE